MAEHINELSKEEASKKTSDRDMDNTVTTTEQTLASSSVICGQEEMANLAEKTEEFKSAAQQLNKLCKIPPVAAEEEEGDGNTCDKCCSWGHPCTGKKDDPCPPCNVKILLRYQKCAHKLILPCCIGAQDKYKENCHKMFPSPWYCFCGEKIYCPCYLRIRRLSLKDAMKFCAKCGQDKDLGTVITYSKKYGG